MDFLPCEFQEGTLLVKIDEIIKIEIDNVNIEKIETDDEKIRIKVYKEKIPHFFECLVKTKYLRQLINK